MLESNVFGSVGVNPINPPNKEFIDSINLNLGYGLYVTEKDYDKYVRGNEVLIARDFHYGYILLVKTGRLDFYHYGPKGLKEINPSKFEFNDNLSFCEGVYCFNQKLHKPVPIKEGWSLYYGSYEGSYVECVCDMCTDGELFKDHGPSKEYVLLTNSPVKVSVYGFN